MKLSRYILPFIFLLIGIILKFGPQWDTDIQSNNHQEAPQPNCTEHQLPATDANLVTTRSWTTFPNFEHYCTRYESNENEFSEAQNFRESYSKYYSTSEEIWGNLYAELYKREKDLLIPLADSLRQIKRSRKLNRTEFANVVVAFIQDIPYCYIQDDDNCATRELKEKDCLPNQKWGILSPVEFLHTLKGDCDTRTVLLYTLLKQLGYSPKIVNSDLYMHSMLLLDIPSTGDHLEYNNRRYYFWETTATGWQCGDLPPAYGNTKHWDIVLY